MELTQLARKTGLALVAVTLLLATFALPAFAARPQAQTDQQLLQLRYDSVDARVGFTTGVLADTASLVSQASDLTTHVEALNADLGTLQTYVAAGDSKGFNSFVGGTLKTDLTAAQDALKTDASHFKEWNVSRETKAQLVSDYKARKAAYEAGVNEAVLQLGSAKLDVYNSALERDDARMANLSSKGVDTSGMESVKAGAEANVVSPLQAAVVAGDANATRAELKGKALGNGAPYSYHYYAKTDLEALMAITARISANATQAGYGDQIADINTHLSAAQSTLDQVGTSSYTADQLNALQADLKAASQELKAVMQGMTKARTTCPPAMAT